MDAINVKPDAIWSESKYTKAFCLQYYKDNEKYSGQAHWRMRTGGTGPITTTDKKIIKELKLKKTMKKNKKKVWIISTGREKSFINGYMKGTPYKECIAPVRAYVDYILKIQSQRNETLKENKIKQIDRKHDKDLNSKKSQEEYLISKNKLLQEKFNILEKKFNDCRDERVIFVDFMNNKIFGWETCDIDIKIRMENYNNNYETMFNDLEIKYERDMNKLRKVIRKLKNKLKT